MSPASTQLPPVCVLAGGLGTRLGDQVKDTPKPLIEVAGEPFLVHQLRLLASYGVERAVLCVGYLGERIEQRIGAECAGITIEYSYDAPELDGTLGAIRRARGLLGPRFLVLYGDTYLRVDYADIARRWEASGLPAVMAVLSKRAAGTPPTRLRGRPRSRTTSARPAPRCTGSITGRGPHGRRPSTPRRRGESDLAGLYTSSRTAASSAATRRASALRDRDAAGLAEADEFLRGRTLEMRP